MTSPCSFWSVTRITRGLTPQASATFAMIVAALSDAAPAYPPAQRSSAVRFVVLCWKSFRHGVPSAAATHPEPRAVRNAWTSAADMTVESQKFCSETR